MAGMETTNLALLYGADPMAWPPVADRLEAGITQAPGSGGPGRHTCWLTTLNADGSPHVTALGTLWAHDAFWFATGATSRKGRNLARDPRCALSVALHELDLTVEGEAERVTDRALLAEMAGRWAAEGWPAEVDPSGEALAAPFSAQSAGPSPWHLYRLAARTATAVETIEPNRATRWRF